MQTARTSPSGLSVADSSAPSIIPHPILTFGAPSPLTWRCDGGTPGARAHRLVIFGWNQRAMTWHTSTGDRHLTGAEAELFRAALKETLEVFERETLDCTDTLLEVQTKEAKVHLFALVAKHLLEPTAEIAPLNAWTEGAVGVVFSCAANALDGELETERTTGEQPQYWRKRILGSALEKGWKSGDEAAEHSAASMAELAQGPDWHEMLEFLEEQILWDNDWATDPFGPLAGDFNRGQESYFQWCHRSTLDTRAAVRLLAQLSGYRRGELEGR